MTLLMYYTRRMWACLYWSIFLSCFILPVRCQNDRPIIGVLAQESPGSLKTHGDTYFMASYVKFLQTAGARVVPVRVGMSAEYYSKLFNSINGVLFPGGDVDLSTSLYAKAARQLYSLAVKARKAGDYFPLWGTCLGFEELSVLTSGENLLVACDAENYLLPLSFTAEGLKSRMLTDTPQNVIEIAKKYKVTSNLHRECLTPKKFANNAALKSFYRVIATGKDRKGTEFLAMFEAYDYPFYGTQWHPEKSIFTWDIRKHLNHSAGAVLLAQSLANFFVKEARKSRHRFADIDEESAALIDNYQPVYRGAPSFELDYFFNVTVFQRPIYRLKAQGMFQDRRRRG